MAPRLREVAPVLVTLVTLAACREQPKPTARVDAAAPNPSARVTTAPSTSAKVAAPPVRIVTPIEDAGAGPGCKLVHGPIQQPLAGPATLTVSQRGLEIVQHRAGIASVSVVPIAAPQLVAKPARQILPDPVEKASKPACAVAGKFAFCSDAQGWVHKSLREMASDERLTQAVPGTRVTAAAFDDEHVVVGTIASRKTAEGELFEAWAKLDGEAPVRISEDGAGTSDVVFVTRKPGEVVAWMIDARTSMTPVHSRVLRYVDKKLQLDRDVVVHVAGGSTRFLHGALGASQSGHVVGLLAAGSEGGFGLLSVALDPSVKEDAPYAFAPYPNGLDGAPLAATVGGKHIVVARVRPALAPGQAPPPVPDGGNPLPFAILELGRVDERGAFHLYGHVPSTGQVISTAIAHDSFGTIWLHYTDQAGSWLERRVCP